MLFYNACGVVISCVAKHIVCCQFKGKGVYKIDCRKGGRETQASFSPCSTRIIVMLPEAPEHSFILAGNETRGANMPAAHMHLHTSLKFGNTI